MHPLRIPGFVSDNTELIQGHMGSDTNAVY